MSTVRSKQSGFTTALMTKRFSMQRHAIKILLANKIIIQRSHNKNSYDDYEHNLFILFLFYFINDYINNAHNAVHNYIVVIYKPWS